LAGRALGDDLTAVASTPATMKTSDAYFTSVAAAGAVLVVVRRVIIEE
jgi:hypothetical protein